MQCAEYLGFRRTLVDMGYADDIQWAQTVARPLNADAFVREYIFVVCNSGMKAQIAAGIYRKVISALEAGQSALSVFGHKGKAEAIDTVWKAQDDWFSGYLAAPDQVSFLESLPWIGGITKWHLAKNFGVDAVKPDRHLVRVAERHGVTPDALCRALAEQTGDRIGTVDYVIWRACNLGLIRHV
jgi:hypothetical protein